MTPEDFAAWRENPVTRWVMDALETVADLNEQAVKSMAWQAAVEATASELNAEELNALAVQAKVYRQIATASHGHFANWSEDEHERD